MITRKSGVGGAMLGTPSPTTPGTPFSVRSQGVSYSPAVGAALDRVSSAVWRSLVRIETLKNSTPAAALPVAGDRNSEVCCGVLAPTRTAPS